MIILTPIPVEPKKALERGGMRGANNSRVSVGGQR